MSHMILETIEGKAEAVLQEANSILFWIKSVSDLEPEYEPIIHEIRSSYVDLKQFLADYKTASPMAGEFILVTKTRNLQKILDKHRSLTNQM